MVTMISAVKYESQPGYRFTLSDGSTGGTGPGRGRFEFYDDLRIASGITTSEFVGPTDMELWKEKMAVSDVPLPRWAEDLVDGTISSQTQKLADDKKALRATKP